MDAGTAAKHGFAVGDRVRVLLSGAAKEFRIVGLFGFGDRTDFGAVTFAAFDLATAQREFDAGSVDRRGLRAARARTCPTAVLQQRLETALGPAYEVLTADAGDAAGRQAGAAVPRLLHRRAARLRRDRGRRRRVHHLQHLHHPGGAAHPRARAAAGDGRDRRPGRAVGGARGVPRRRGRVGARAARGHRPRRGPPRAAARARARPPRHHDGAARRARSSCRSWSASWSRWSPRCSPRSGRRGCRRWPRSPTCRARAVGGFRRPRRRRARRARGRRRACSSTGWPAPATSPGSSTRCRWSRSARSACSSAS